MKTIMTFCAVLGLVWAMESGAARLVCNTHDDDWNWFTTVCNTATEDIESMRVPYIRAIADDGTMYGTEHDLQWPETEGEQCRYVQRIVRLVGHPLIPERISWETVYEEASVYDAYPEEATYVNEDGEIVEGELMVCWPRDGIHFHDLEVRNIDDAGNHRLYISHACGACDTKAIHYVDADGSGVKTLYFDLATAPIGVASCEGRLSSYWSGNFYFDNDENLFISSGNHRPAALFRIGGAGLDEVTGPVEQVFESGMGMMDFVFEDENIFYFHSVRGPDINRGDLVTGDTTLVFSSPGDARISDLLRYQPETEDGEPSLPGSGMMSRPSRAGKRLLPPEMAARHLPPRPSDILISEIEIDKPIKAAGDMGMRIPVRLILKNGGDAVSDAIIVRVAVQVPGQKKLQPVPFYIAGSKGKEQVIRGLGYRQEIALAGFVELTPHLARMNNLSSGGELALIARAERCDPNDKRKRSCTTRDANRANNSRVFKVLLP